MAELTLKIAPSAFVVEPPTGPVGKPVLRAVEKRVEVPAPKPLALQIVAVVLLVALTAALVVLLGKDPSVVAAAFLGAGLVMCVFCIAVWVSAVLGLGIGPAQLLALLTTVVRAIKESTASKPDTTKPAPTPGQPGAPTPGQPGAPTGGH
jgi:hypothetical protein